MHVGAGATLALGGGVFRADDPGVRAARRADRSSAIAKPAIAGAADRRGGAGDQAPARSSMSGAPASASRTVMARDLRCDPGAAGGTVGAARGGAVGRCCRFRL
ncbi:MAG: hypothetical protein MZU95_10645 [Desulfomicrobium escambiense]|nr:hypothetical protein [Desulfomicrobium escambiense]